MSVLQNALYSENCLSCMWRFISWATSLVEGRFLQSFQIKSVLFKEDYYPTSLVLTGGPTGPLKKSWRTLPTLSQLWRRWNLRIQLEFCSSDKCIGDLKFFLSPAIWALRIPIAKYEEYGTFTWHLQSMRGVKTFLFIGFIFIFWKHWCSIQFSKTPITF